VWYIIFVIDSIVLIVMVDVIYIFVGNETEQEEATVYQKHKILRKLRG
jgi:hypothetical protein